MFWRVTAGAVLSLLLLTIFAAAVLLRVRVARKKKRSINYIFHEECISSPAAGSADKEVASRG